MASDLSPAYLLQILIQKGGAAKRKKLIKEFGERWQRAISQLICDGCVEDRDNNYVVTEKGMGK